MINLNNIDPIIKTSLEYYDSHNIKIDKFIKDIVYLEFINNNNQTDQIKFYDNDKNLLLISSYEIIGFYIPQNKIWKWAWAVPTIVKKYTYYARKILSYAFDLDSIKDYLVKSSLINSKVSIMNNIQLDIYIALASYISKKPFIFKFYNSIYNDGDNDDSNLINYQKILKDTEIDNYIISYIIILDYKIQ